MLVVRNILLLVLGAMVYGCTNIAGEMRQDEVSRVISPSGAVEAVLVETNGGATTSFGYEVYVVEAQKRYNPEGQVATLYGAIRSNSAYGVNLVWDGDEHLTIQYLEAKNERILSSPINVGNQRIEIILKKGVEDGVAPPGGMLYNLQGRPHG